MFHNVLGLWDGLDECEISRPEILSQSAPDYIYINYLLLFICLFICLFTIPLSDETLTRSRDSLWSLKIQWHFS